MSKLFILAWGATEVPAEFGGKVADAVEAGADRCLGYRAKVAPKQLAGGFQPPFFYIFRRRKFVILLELPAKVDLTGAKLL